MLDNLLESIREVKLLNDLMDEYRRAIPTGNNINFYMMLPYHHVDDLNMQVGGYQFGVFRIDSGSYKQNHKQLIEEGYFYEHQLLYPRKALEIIAMLISSDLLMFKGRFFYTGQEQFLFRRPVEDMAKAFLRQIIRMGMANCEQSGSAPFIPDKDFYKSATFFDYLMKIDEYINGNS